MIVSMLLKYIVLVEFERNLRRSKNFLVVMNFDLYVGEVYIFLDKILK